MKKEIKALAAGLLALAAAANLWGCALISFDDPDDAKEREDSLATVDQALLPNAARLLNSERLYLEDSLTDDSGAVIAKYVASFPYFDNEDGSAALDKINQYYENEFSQIESDKERFFRMVAEKPSQQVRSCTFSFELLEGPEEYIAVVREYRSMDTLGAESTDSYCELFAAATGWKLKFTDLFGSSAQEALDLIREELESWCREREYSTGWIYRLEGDKLTESFTMDSQSIYLAFDRGAVPGGETLVCLDGQGLMEYLSAQ